MMERNSGFYGDITSWHHPSVVVAVFPNGREGISSETIPGHMPLAPVDGDIYWGVTCDEDLPPEVRGYPFQIAPTVVRDSKSIARVFSHSCNPNAGLRWIAGLVWVITRRVILPGERITWDYAMSQYSDDFTLYPQGKRCECGSFLCRGTRLGFESLPAIPRRMYIREGLVLPHVLQMEQERARRQKQFWRNVQRNLDVYGMPLLHRAA